MQSKNKLFGNTCIGLKINRLLTIGVHIQVAPGPIRRVFLSALLIIFYLLGNIISFCTRIN